jgi:hypothetical protein
MNGRSVGLWVFYTLAVLVLVCPQADQWQARAGDVQTQVISARAGLVTRVEGEVLFRRRDEKELRPLKAGVRLGDGDTIITAWNGRAEWTLSPDSFLQIGSDSNVRIYATSLDAMHFDIERGEVFIISRSLNGSTSLVLDTPPALLKVVKSGRYRVRVAADSETEAAVRNGELQFVNAEGQIVKVRGRRRVRFASSERRKIWDTAMTTARH